MKKIINKKIVSLLLAAAFVVPTLALTACNNNDSGTNSEKLDGEAAWRAAFDYSNVSSGELSNTERYKMNGVESGSVKYELAIDGNKMKQYEFMTEIDDGEEETAERTTYTEYKADEIFGGGSTGSGTEYRYSYNETDNKWYYVKCASDSMDTFAYYVDSIDGYGMDISDSFGKLSDSYSKFTYNDSVGAYVARYENVSESSDSPQTYSFVEFTVSIKNGKFVKGTITTEREDDGDTERVEMEFAISNVGSTTVDIPTNATEWVEEQEEYFEEEEWTNAFAYASDSSFELVILNNYEIVGAEYDARSDLVRISVYESTDNNMENPIDVSYYENAGSDTFYKYSYDDASSAWTKTQIDAQVYNDRAGVLINNFRNSLNGLRTSYNSFAPITSVESGTGSVHCNDLYIGIVLNVARSVSVEFVDSRLARYDLVFVDETTNDVHTYVFSLIDVIIDLPQIDGGQA